FSGSVIIHFLFFFQAEDGIRDFHVTGVQTCALPILTPYENPTAETFHASRVSGAVVWIAAMLGLAVALSGVPGLLKTLLLMSWLAVEPAMHLESSWEAVLELVFSVTAIAAGAALAGRYRVAPYLLGLLAG